MRRTSFLIFTVLLIALLNISVFAASVPASSFYHFDDTEIGLLGISYTSDSGRQVKLMIQNGTKRHFYDLSPDGSTEYFSLRSGPGNYSISILENNTGTSYRVVSRRNIYVEFIDKTALYLNSIQNIYWDHDMYAIKMAAELTKEKTATIDKVEAIYEYIIKNIRYDRTKLNNVSSGYIPDIQDTFRTKTGICYDYSALFAAMLRSQGIPAKLVTGYNPLVSGYHAWNEVYIEETDKWVSIDTTADAAFQKLSKPQMIKIFINPVIMNIY